MMLNNAIARILDANGRVSGAGFLVTGKYILTCAHVISQALRKYDIEKPSEDIILDFPATASRDVYKARVIIWRPEENTDLAGLELLSEAPKGAEPPRLVLEDGANLWGHFFRAYGFPKGYELGVWSAGIVRGQTATNDWIQIESGQDVGYRIQPGFSGSPVWDESLSGVVGIIVASDVQSRAAFIVTTSKIAEVWPTLSFEPPRKTAPTKEERKLKVFLCHASGDKPAVRKLYKKLLADGVEPWLDEENLIPGKRWQQEIPKAVRSSDTVLICLSQNSITKAGYVQKEIKFALDVADEQPDDKIFLIPVRLETCEVPDRLTPFQWVNLYEDKGYDRLMTSLRICEQSIGIRGKPTHPSYTSPTQPKSKVSILFLAADPTDTSRLRLGEEVREIGEKLQLSQWRDQFNLHTRFAVRPSDFSQAMLDVSPQIVHFSGHGSTGGELIFEDVQGKAQLVSSSALAALFGQFGGLVQCVVLNSCYSESQAQAISAHVEYVVGTNKAIGDKAAIAFTVGFYQALGAGRNVEEAFKLGCVQVQLQGIPEHLTPVLVKNGHLQI